jgi:hypothetical protein
LNWKKRNMEVYFPYSSPQQADGEFKFKTYSSCVSAMQSYSRRWGMEYSACHTRGWIKQSGRAQRIGKFAFIFSLLFVQAIMAIQSLYKCGGIV